MFWTLLFPVIIMLPAGALMHYLPGLRTGTCFAVRVGPDFADSAEGRDVLTRYRWHHAAFFLVGLVLMIAGMARANSWLLVCGPLLHSFGAMAALRIGRTRVWPHRLATETQRTATLSVADPVPLWTLPLWTLPALILGFAAWHLSRNWDVIPASFPVHWGIDGQANRWVQKSFKGVFGILMMGGSTMAMLYGVFAAILFGARRTPGDLRTLRAVLISLLGVMISVALLMARIALGPLLAQPGQSPIPLPVALAAPLVLIAVSLIPVWRVRNDLADSSDITPDECWSIGNLYSNRNDPALMVRNRMGFGYSPNLGHPIMKIACLVALVQFVIVLRYVTR